MKKRFLLLIAVAVILIANPNESKAQLSFGWKAGYSLSTLGSTLVDGPEYTPRHSWHTGPFIEAEVAFLAIQVEALYSPQGAKFSDDNGDFTLKNDYIVFPALAKIKLGPLDVHGGIQYDMLISSKLTGGTDDIDTKDSYKNGLSLPLGAGIDVSKFQIEARYNIGLNSILNNPPTDEEVVANGVFMVSLGIKL